jgi:hypothetical protein
LYNEPEDETPARELNIPAADANDALEQARKLMLPAEKKVEIEFQDDTGRINTQVYGRES